MAGARAHTYAATRAETVTRSRANAEPKIIKSGGETMDLLWTIAVILLILWLLGLVTSYTLGGFIHILLVLAIVVILIRIIQGRRPV